MKYVFNVCIVHSAQYAHSMHTSSTVINAYCAHKHMPNATERKRNENSAFEMKIVAKDGKIQSRSISILKIYATALE